MPDMKSYLDYEGLTIYNGKIQAQMNKKVDAVTGKGLSTNDFTTEEKDKLEGLKNYILPASDEDTLGGVVINSTEDPIPEKTALKVDATGKAFVDWSEAPMASTTRAGIVKLGEGFKLDENGNVAVDDESITAGSVAWTSITGKPDLATKADLTNVYTYKGSVATYAALPTENLTAGDVYNVETTGMNYAWTGTKWDDLGGSFEISTITASQIDALFNDEPPQVEVPGDGEGNI